MRRNSAIWSGPYLDQLLRRRRRLGAQVAKKLGDGLITIVRRAFSASGTRVLLRYWVAEAIRGPIGKIGHRNWTPGQHCRKRSRHAMIEAAASPGRESSVKSSHFRPYLCIQMFRGRVVVAAADACREAAVPTIALVDDDRNILTSLSIALEAEGYQINTYIDGFAALTGFRTEPPDLAILDIKMPRMDGMETLRQLRQKSDLPVIFLTSRDDEMDELISLKMGADDYIRKPFSPRLLLERVKVLLRRALPKDRAAAREAGSKVLERGELRMDPERHCCTWKNEPVMLTRNGISHAAGASEQARGGEKPKRFDGCSLRR